MRLRRIQRRSRGITNLSVLIYLLAVLMVWFSLSSTKASTVNNQSQVASAEVEPSTPDQVEMTNSLEEFDGVSTVLHEFVATAYCLAGQTASGHEVRSGIIAADPEVLPIGSVVRLYAGRYSGVYTVLDTGLKIRGRMVDIWIPDEGEAIQFGVRRVRLQVLRYGWRQKPVMNADDDR